MIPVGIIAFCDYIMPVARVQQIADMIPFQMTAFEAMFYFFALVYVPMGLRLILQMGAGATANSTPRKTVEQFIATSKLGFRLHSAHNNLLEGAPFFIGATLACLAAGVDKGALEACCLVYMAARASYVVIYATISANELGGWVRTLNFFVSLATNAKMFQLAATGK